VAALEILDPPASYYGYPNPTPFPVNVGRFVDAGTAKTRRQQGPTSSIDNQSPQLVNNVSISSASLTEPGSPHPNRRQCTLMYVFNCGVHGY